VEPWTLIPSAGLQAYKHRREVTDIWTRLKHLWRRIWRLCRFLFQPGTTTDEDRRTRRLGKWSRSSGRSNGALPRRRAGPPWSAQSFDSLVEVWDWLATMGYARSRRVVGRDGEEWHAVNHPLVGRGRCVSHNGPGGIEVEPKPAPQAPAASRRGGTERILRLRESGTRDAALTHLPKRRSHRNAGSP
jgi:hypothetical protein